MRRIQKTCALATIVACQAALAQVPAPESPVSSEDAQQIAMLLATCAGVWDAMSEGAASNESPASAEQLRNMGNGAETAAMWVLASHMAMTEKKATKYGSWSELTRPKRESGKTMIRALAENSGQKEINAELELCQTLLTEQEKILQRMRMDRVRQAQGE